MNENDPNIASSAQAEPAPSPKITTTAHIESGDTVVQPPVAPAPSPESTAAQDQTGQAPAGAPSPAATTGMKAGAVGSDKVEATVVRALGPKEAQEHAFTRARNNVGKLHALLNNAAGVETLAKDELMKLIAALGRDLQHLI